MNSILKKELSRLDREYSYENTVQLGRYRLDSGDDDLDDNDKTTPLKNILPDNEQKKSVRFSEYDPREEMQEIRYSKSWKGMMSKFIGRLKKFKPNYSLSAIRGMLIDWLYLAVLGIGVALTSMLIDGMIEYMQTFQMLIMSLSGQTGNVVGDYACTYLSWLGYTELLVICSATFVHYVAPQAIGSGVPEMKTILRGVILKDYLTFRTLISKLVGLTFSLGSGLPIGKMGPFVHLSSICGNLLSHLASTFDGAFANECRKSEMLAAACAVGVACTFSAPVGGVLLSIELTTMYFSVRNYWRGFLASACGATVFRLLRVYVFEAEVTLLAFYQTHFPKDAFEPDELPIFALMGVLAGLMAVVFIQFYKTVVMFLRTHPFAKRFFQRNWIVYPIVVAFLVASITYPRGYGRFLAGRFKFTKTLLDFFANCTWSKPVFSDESPHGCSPEILASWTNHEGYGPYSVYLVLFLFMTTYLFLSALCNTMPIPCGMFMPIFIVGAALGRLVGEVVSTIWPDGMGGGTEQPIYPGVYSVVGAAAFSGAVTHSVSVVVICCEITGQVIYIIPLMIAVIISNAVSTYFLPSIYDCIIQIKHLPYLPDIPPSNSMIHMFCAEHIMVSPVRFLARITKYDEIRNILVDLPKLRSFPVVDDPNSMMLLGSIPRRSLLELLQKQIGDETRTAEAQRRIRLAIETIDKHFKESQLPPTSKSGREREDDLSSTKSLPRETPYKRKATFSFPDITRVQSESRLYNLLNNNGKGSLRRTRKTSENYDDRLIDPDIKPKKRSRFTIEPVSTTNQEPIATPTSPTSTSSAQKQPTQVKLMKKLSRKETFDVNPKARIRRNAFSSMSTQGRADVSDEESGSESVTSGHKDSWPDLIKDRNLMPHENQLSITRDLAEYVKRAKKRLHFMHTHHIKKEEISNMEYDLFEDERRDWELRQLQEEVELGEKYIDPAPFQLVRKTSLYKVHSLFSLLDLNRAYVTDRGRLVGVVALRDLRIAIEQAQNGIPIKSILKQMNSDENINSDGEKPQDIETGLAMLGSGTGKHNTPEPDPEMAKTFSEEIERKRSNINEFEEEPLKDILTPSLKVVHPSAASLHSFFINHPTMLTIQEEDGLSAYGSVNERDTTPRPSILECPDSDEAEQLKNAVAYLRRKSLAPEESKQNLDEEFDENPKM